MTNKKLPQNDQATQFSKTLAQRQADLKTIKPWVGKSNLFQNMALQDIHNRAGICFIDPHGESIEWLLERIPANRYEDIILFDPADTNFPFGLNLLEASTESEQDFLVAELIS